MENNNKKEDEIVASLEKEETQKIPEPTGRLNIDDINKRNAEEKRKENHHTF